MRNNQNLEKELNIKEVSILLKKHITTIIIVTLIVTFVSWSVSYFLLEPVYETSTELLVNKSEDDQVNAYNINDINTDLKLISTYSLIINSPRITDLVIKEYGLKITSDELVKKVSINNVTDSQVMKITVRDSNHSEAVKIANAIAKVFQREIVSIMNVKNVNILTKAKNMDNPKPVSPNLIFNTFIAFVLGLMLSIVIVILLNYREQGTNREIIKETEDYFGYVILGTIPYTENINIQKNPLISEELKALGTNVRISSSNKLIKSILVTSISPQEGKSTAIRNLAIVLAQKNKKVLLIDLNMRNPAVHKLFGLSNNVGISNVVVGLNSLEEAIQRTSQVNLFILTSGVIPTNPPRIIESDRIERVIKELYENYDYLLFDTPPIIFENDTQKLTKYADGIILVIKSERKYQETEIAIKSRGLPNSIKEKMLGIVLNTNEKQNEGP